MQLQSFIGFIINFRRPESLQTNGKAPLLALFKYKIKGKSKGGRSRENHRINDVTVLRPWLLLWNPLWRNFLLHMVLFFLIFLDVVALDQIGELFPSWKVRVQRTFCFLLIFLLKTLHVECHKPQLISHQLWSLVVLREIMLAVNKGIILKHI